MLIFVIYNDEEFIFIVRQTMKNTLINFNFFHNNNLIFTNSFLGLIYYQIFIPLCGDFLKEKAVEPISKFVEKAYSKW